MRLCLAFVLCVMVSMVQIATAETARIAVAANFKTVADELVAAFEARGEHDIDLSAGSTGKLYAQIARGAPFDAFLAADQVRPRRLVEEGGAVEASLFTYATGRLTLWSKSGATPDPDQIRLGDIRRLAIANPDLAPYGAAAQQVLDALTLRDAVEGRIVLGENIGQTFAFVHTGNAELGFVALSQVLSLPVELQGVRWDPAMQLYDPIRQDAVLLRRGDGNTAAMDFLEFLKGEEAQRIISDRGYVVE